MKKRFTLTDKNGTKRPDDFSLSTSAEVGWDNPALGVVILDELEVGEATEDQDGDTWERVA